MRIKIHYAILLGILLILSSCKEDPNEYFSEQRSNLVGEWTVIITQRAYVENVLEFETEGSEFNIIINEDGTGSRVDNTTAADEREFEWLYQLNPQQIVFYYPTPGGGNFLESTIFYNIISNTASHQSWESESFPDLGIYDRYEYEWEMTKL
ncbi:MAG: hypothetical protein ACI94Y_001160 [Maribacter sp.]|jgi:hypothetical protein